MSDRTRSITVGLGPDGASAAIRYAADHAARDQATLHLVHVLSHPTAEPFPVPYDQAVALARGALSRAAVLASERQPGLDVTTQLLREGQVVRQIAEHSATSRYLVVEHRRFSTWHRLLTGSTSNGIASRTSVPVVCVPEDWSAAAAEPGRPTITVGVQDVAEADRLLAVARDLARAHGARIRVLHAWWMNNGLDTQLEDEHLRSWKERVRARLGQAVDEADLGGIPTRVDVVHQPPLEAMVDVAARSLLMVIGCRHHLLPFGSHLGPVARGTTAHARCPVVLTPPADAGSHHDEHG